MTDHKTMYECAVEFARSLIHEANEQSEKIRRLEAEIRELRAQAEELRFNPNHDPKNGRFTSDESGGKGVDISGKSGIIEDKKISPPKDYSLQSAKALETGIKKDLRQIERHKDKIANPSKYISTWDTENEYYKQGCIKHWNTEIVNFERQIQFRKDELERRDNNE